MRLRHFAQQNVCWALSKRKHGGRLIALSYLLPVIAGAQDDFDEQFGTFAAFARFLVSLRRIVNLLIPVVVGIALLSFMWGLTRFIANAGDEEAQKKAKSLMIVGIIGFTVMTSLWGIVAFIQESLGIEQTVIEIPVSETPASQSGSVPLGGSGTTSVQFGR